MFWVAYYLVFLYFLYLAKRFNNAHSILLVIMIFFLGQRWMTGEDFPGYLLYYLIDFKGVDFSFFLFQDLFKSLELSFSMFVFSLYTITILLIYKFINKFSYSSLVFVLFSITELSFIQLSQLKQSLAIPFFLFSFYYFYNKRNLPGFFFIVISSTIHVAALFLLPLLFIKIPVKKKPVAIMLAIISLLPLLDITRFIPISLYFKFSHYLDSEYNQTLSIFHYLKFYGVLLLFYFLYRSNSEDSIYEKRFLITGMLIYLGLYAFSFQFAPFMRLSYFFRIFEVIILVNLALDSSARRYFSYYVLPFYSLAFLAITILDPYNVSRYSFQPLTLYESKTDAQLYLEIEQFYEE